jgi:phytoene dehydrogenase-like protein
MKETQVAIIGAGLAGLSVAKKLISQNINVLLIEKSNCIGGKQKTSIINGYQCDHGFQILLSAYPEVAQQLDLKALKPLRFNAGAKLWDNHSFKTLGDPISSPWLLPYLMYHPIASWKDLLKLFKLKCYLSGLQSADIFALPNQTTYNAINDLKFYFIGNVFLKDMH